MNQQPTNVTEALKPVLDKVHVKNWYENQSLCLGGAGASLAVLLVALQLAAGAKSSSDAYGVAMAFSAIAMLLWLVLWQISDTYVFWGDEALPHSKRVRWISCGLAVICLAVGLLGASLVVLISVFSPVAALVTLVAVVAAVLFVFWHAHAVKVHVQSSPQVNTTPPDACAKPTSKRPTRRRK